MTFIDTLAEAMAKHRLLERPMDSDLILRLCDLEKIQIPVRPEGLEETFQILLRYDRAFETETTVLDRYGRGSEDYVFRMREATGV